MKEERPELLPLPSRSFEILMQAVKSIFQTDLSVAFASVYYILQKKYEGLVVEITASYDIIVINTKFERLC